MTEVMEPNLDNGGGWHHIATERELQTVLRRDKEPEIYECPPICMTFVVSRRFMVIIRANAFGGDTQAIEGGWVYDNLGRFFVDLQEIRSLWAAMGGYGRNAGGVTKES